MWQLHAATLCILRSEIVTLNLHGIDPLLVMLGMPKSSNAKVVWRNEEGSAKSTCRKTVCKWGWMRQHGGTGHWLYIGKECHMATWTGSLKTNVKTYVKTNVIQFATGARNKSGNFEVSRRPFHIALIRTGSGRCGLQSFRLQWVF